MPISRRRLLASASAAAALPRIRRLEAQGAKAIKLGVLTDLSGTYRDTTGPGSVACTQQAAEDFGDKGFKVEVISADHQNKPDVGAGIARQWFDTEGVDAIVDVPTSSVALAVNNICKEKNKVFLNSGAATTELTGKQCTPNVVHWTYNTYMLAKSMGTNVVKQGGASWFFITADYVFGHQLQRDTTKFVLDAGGKVLGSAAYPFPGTTDFSSFLIQAQASGAKVLGLAMAGNDTVNSIKQAHEFGLQMQIAGLLMELIDVKAIGQDAAAGLLLTESFYWDLNDRTRSFAKRVQKRLADWAPNMVQAGCYGASMHYLKAVADIGVDKAKSDGAAAIARMKQFAINEDAFNSGSVREDGQALIPVYLFQVKPPSESKGEWDIYKTLITTPADQAWQPLDPECPLVKKS